MSSELQLAYNLTAAALTHGYEATIEKSFDAPAAAGDYSLRLSDELLKKGREEREAELREREARARMTREQELVYNVKQNSNLRQVMLKAAQGLEYPDTTSALCRFKMLGHAQKWVMIVCLMIKRSTLQRIIITIPNWECLRLRLYGM